jgi:hypothetical protein
MPLPQPVQRELRHQRRIALDGYRRHDGLYDIEARIIDTKAYTFTDAMGAMAPAGQPIHHMIMRVTIDKHLQVHDVEAVTEVAPYSHCGAITPNFKRLIGLTIGAGWRRNVAQRLGGTEGCTHLVELLMPIATVAFQTVAEWEAPQPGKKPFQLDGCHAWASDGPIAKALLPDFYTGPKT